MRDHDEDIRACRYQAPMSYLDEKLDEFLSWLLLITLLRPGAIVLGFHVCFPEDSRIRVMRHAQDDVERSADSAVQSSRNLDSRDLRAMLANSDRAPSRRILRLFQAAQRGVLPSRETSRALNINSY